MGANAFGISISIVGMVIWRFSCVQSGRIGDSDHLDSHLYSPIFSSSFDANGLLRLAVTAIQRILIEPIIAFQCVLQT